MGELALARSSWAIQPTARTTASVIRPSFSASRRKLSAVSCAKLSSPRTTLPISSPRTPSAASKSCVVHAFVEREEVAHDIEVEEARAAAEQADAAPGLAVEAAGAADRSSPGTRTRIPWAYSPGYLSSSSKPTTRKCARSCASSSSSEDSRRPCVGAFLLRSRRGGGPSASTSGSPSIPPMPPDSFVRTAS